MEQALAASQTATTVPSWARCYGNEHCHVMAGCSSCSTWISRSFWQRTGWAACTVPPTPPQLRYPRKALSRPFPTRAPSACPPRPHTAPLRPHRHPPPPLPRPLCLGWTCIRRKAWWERQTACTVSFLSQLAAAEHKLERMLKTHETNGLRAGRRDEERKCRGPKMRSYSVQTLPQFCLQEFPGIFVRLRVVKSTRLVPWVCVTV